MIRDLEKADIPACIAIVLDNWNQDTADRFSHEISHALNGSMKWPPEYFVFEISKEIVGFAGMMPSWLMYGVWDLIWINVKKDFQGQSIGSQLTHLRISEIDRLGGSVINLMTKNTKFFSKFSFKTTYRYQGGWNLMTRQLRTLQL